MGDETYILEFGTQYPLKVRRPEANFDRACDEAQVKAEELFDLSGEGRFSCIPGWCVGTSFVRVEFVRYSRVQSEHLYEFTAYAIRNDY